MTASDAMTAEDLLQRARSGDGEAFAGLVQPHRRELHVHCYRMLGSFDDADDALQETLLAAWRGLPAFQARASVRTWLYRVATNTCLNQLRTASRRPQPALGLPASGPAPTGSDPVTWLQPYPDVLLDGLPDDDPGPEAQVERSEAVSLAFITALQLLSPRARAVLVLRNVLGFTAREVAGTLDATEQAVAMTLSRARAAVRAKVPRPGGPSDPGLARRLAAALTAHDIGLVVSLLTEDVRIAMPPLPAIYAGQERAAEFLTEVAFQLVPEARFVETQANRQPALAVYSRDGSAGRWHGSGLLVLTPRGSQVCALTRFESHTLTAFEMPSVLGADGQLG